MLVPGALALAEDLDVSGRRLLDGFIVGFEIASRIGRGLAPALLDRGWHPNGILGGIGVATAGARMMGLDLTKTRMAIGIAASEASGLRKNVGSMGKAFHVGLGARNGAFAAFLAQRGYQVDPISSSRPTPRSAAISASASPKRSRAPAATTWLRWSTGSARVGS